MADEIVTRSVILDTLAEVRTGTEEQEFLARQANSSYGLLSSIPMKCRTTRCPYKSICPLMENGVAIDGSRCSIESAMVRDMFIAYCQEMEINPDVDKVKAGLVKDLVAVEIQALRANKLMSFEDFIVDAVEAINPVDGEIILRKDLHVAVSWSERLLNQKIRILDTLAATPLVKARYMGGDQKKGLMDQMAENKRKAEALMQVDDTEDAEYEMILDEEDA